MKAPLKRAYAARDKCLKIQNESTVLDNNIILNSEAASRLGASSVNVTGKKGNGFYILLIVSTQTDLRPSDVQTRRFFFFFKQFFKL